MFLVAVSMSGQVVLSADAPKVVATGETFRLVYSVNAEPASFNPPKISGLQVLAGPTSSTMSSTQIINGKRTETFQVSYTYILQAGQEGKYTIPPASVVVDGKTYNSGSLVVEAVKASGQTSADDSGQKTGAVSNDDIFLSLTVSKNKVVVGEQLVATLKLYTRVPVTGFEDVRFPSFNGFWSQEIETPSNIEFVRENVNGNIYEAALLRRYMLLPQQSGKLIIDGAEMMCQVRIRTGSDVPRSIFDDFFDSYQTIRKRVSAKPLTIVSDPLPKGAPLSFNGAVGSFSVSARVTRDSVDANEALSFLIDVKGTGNLNLIEAPKPEIPSAFELYDTKITDNSTQGISGTKSFEFPLIARAPGVYTIPPVIFSYYDISKNSYEELSTEAIVVKVGNANSNQSQNPGQGVSLGVNRQAVRSISDDIRYIYSSLPSLAKGNLFFFGSVVYFGLLVMIFVLFLAIERYLSHRIERNRDIAGVRNRKAVKIAKAKLKRAGILLKEGNYSAFYMELHMALLGYVSDKLNLELSDISRDKISGLLYSRNIDNGIVDELLYLLDQCEYARYAPNPGGEGMDNNFSRAIDLISSLEL